MKVAHLIHFINLFQYFSPYLSADMGKMAVAFNTTVLKLEDELMQLILDGQINARIDSHSKVIEPLIHKLAYSSLVFPCIRMMMDIVL